MDATRAINDLLGEQHLPERRTGSYREDLILAGLETVRRRLANTRNGAEVIEAMVADGMTYREIEDEIGVPKSTAHNWKNPPPVAVVP